MLKWLGLVLVAACGTLVRPPDPSRRLDIHSGGTVFDADRGYRFVVLPEPGASVVRIDARYPVGAIDDPPGKEGLAHLVEHLLTEVEVDKTSLDAEMARVSLAYNAYTTEESTTYEAVALPGALDDLMRIEGERLTIGCAGIPRELFEREREVVRNELRERQGGGGAELRRAIYEGVYPPGHPYRRVDTPETVAGITYEDVCAFIATAYRHGTAIVTVSGAVDVPAVQAAVAAHLARVPRRSPAAPPPIALAPVQGGTVKLRGAVDEPTLIVTWPLPAKASEAFRLLALVSGHLAGDLERYAVMFHWGHSAQMYVMGGPRAPVLALSIQLDEAGDADEAKSRVASALRDLFYEIARPGAEPKDPYWVRTWEGSAELLLAQWETLAGRDELMADFQQYEPTGSVVARVRELSASRPLAVRALAEEWLAASRARYFVVEPSGAVDIGAGGVFAGAVEQHAAKVDPALADQPATLPQASPRIATERYTQDNGLVVVLAPSTSAPLVQARLVVDAGAADAPFGKEGVAYVVGAEDVYPDALEFDDRSLSIRVDDLVRSVSSELRVPGYGLSDDGKKYLVARLLQPRVVERDAYDTDVLLALYGEGHPYARSPISAAGINHLSQDSVESWARSHITPKNSTLVLSGAFDPALITRHIAYNSDQVDPGSRTRDLTTPPRTTPGFVAGVTTKPSPTLELSAYFAGGSGVDRDYAKRLVLEAVLDAQLAQLREKRALTYGFYASYEPRRAGGMWTIGGRVDATRAVEAGQAIISILDDLRRSPETSRSAFVLGRQKVLETLLAKATSTADVADRLAFLARFDLPDDFYDTLASSVAHLTLPELHAFLVKELAADHQVIGAFGNAAPAQAALAAARAVKPGEQPASVVDPFQ